MKTRKVLVINDIFTRSTQGEQQLKDFRDEYLPSLQVDAYFFASEQSMAEQVDDAVRQAIRGQYAVSSKQ